MRDEAAAKGLPAARRGADEGARAVERQRRHVPAERRPLSVRIEVLLDVGEIEGRDGRIVSLEIRADRANRLRPGEVADDGDDEIPGLEILQKREARLG